MKKIKPMCCNCQCDNSPSFHRLRYVYNFQDSFYHFINSWANNRFRKRWRIIIGCKDSLFRDRVFQYTQTNIIGKHLLLDIVCSLISEFCLLIPRVCCYVDRHPTYPSVYTWHNYWSKWGPWHWNYEIKRDELYM